MTPTPTLPAWLDELKAADDYSQTVFKEQVVKHGQRLLRIAEAAAAVEQIDYTLKLVKVFPELHIALSNLRAALHGESDADRPEKGEGEGG